MQEKLSTGEHVFLLDWSSNGTLVNRQKVGELQIFLSYKD